MFKSTRQVSDMFDMHSPAGGNDAAAGLEVEAMRGAAARACSLLKVLANPDRLMLLCQLAQGELCVSDMEARLGIRQPTLSQQLGVLRDSGVVSTRREGKSIIYAIASPEAMAVMQTLYAHYCAESDEADEAHAAGPQGRAGKR